MQHYEQCRYIVVHDGELLKATCHKGLLNERIKEVIIGQAFRGLGWRGNEMYADLREVLRKAGLWF
jgi:hypothetical protein